MIILREEIYPGKQKFEIDTEESPRLVGRIVTGFMSELLPQIFKDCNETWCASSVDVPDILDFQGYLITCSGIFNLLPGCNFLKQHLCSKLKLFIQILADVIKI